MTMNRRKRPTAPQVARPFAAIAPIIHCAMLVLVLCVPDALAQTRDEHVARCVNRTGTIPPEQQIAACTAMIQSGDWGTGNTAIAFANRGNAWRQGGDLESAIADYNEALRLNPHDAEVLVNRGIAWREGGDIDRAFADYNEALRVDPRFAAAFYNRGNVWLIRGDIDRAIADYDQALRVNPRFAEVFYNRGNAWRISGDLDRAIADFSETVRLNPRHYPAFNNRGTAWIDKGDLDRAIADFSETLRLNPRSVLSLRNRCIARVRHGEGRGALQDCDDSVSGMGSGAWPLSSRAGAFLLIQDLDAADRDIAAALSHQPRDAMALWLRAALLQQRGDAAGAEADRTAAMAIRPGIAAETERLLGRRF